MKNYKLTCNEDGVTETIRAADMDTALARRIATENRAVVQQHDLDSVPRRGNGSAQSCHAPSDNAEVNVVCHLFEFRQVLSLPPAERRGSAAAAYCPKLLRSTASCRQQPLVRFLFYGSVKHVPAFTRETW